MYYRSDGSGELREGAPSEVSVHREAYRAEGMICIIDPMDLVS